MGIMNKLSKQTQNSKRKVTVWFNQFLSKENGLGKAKVWRIHVYAKTPFVLQYITDKYFPHFL